MHLSRTHTSTLQRDKKYSLSYNNCLDQHWDGPKRYSSRNPLLLTEFYRPFQGSVWTSGGGFFSQRSALKPVTGQKDRLRVGLLTVYRRGLNPALRLQLDSMIIWDWKNSCSKLSVFTWGYSPAIKEQTQWRMFLAEAYLRKLLSHHQKRCK